MKKGLLIGLIIALLVSVYINLESNENSAINYAIDYADEYIVDSSQPIAYLGEVVRRDILNEHMIDSFEIGNDSELCIIDKTYYSLNYNNNNISIYKKIDGRWQYVFSSDDLINILPYNGTISSIKLLDVKDDELFFYVFQVADGFSAYKTLFKYSQKDRCISKIFEYGICYGDDYLGFDDGVIVANCFDYNSDKNTYSSRIQYLNPETKISWLDNENTLGIDKNCEYYLFADIANDIVQIISDKYTLSVSPLDYNVLETVCEKDTIALPVRFREKHILRLSNNSKIWNNMSNYDNNRVSDTSEALVMEGLGLYVNGKWKCLALPTEYGIYPFYNLKLFDSYLTWDTNTVMYNGHNTVSFIIYDIENEVFYQLYKEIYDKEEQAVIHCTALCSNYIEFVVQQYKADKILVQIYRYPISELNR